MLKKLILAGIGQADPAYLPKNILDAINSGDHFILQSKDIIIAKYLEKQGKNIYVFDAFSDSYGPQAIKGLINDLCNKHGQAFLLPLGQGVVDFQYFNLVKEICKNEDIELQVLPGIPLAYCAISALNERGMLLDAKDIDSITDFTDDLKIDTLNTNVFIGLNNQEKALKLKKALLKYCEEETQVFVINWSKEAEIIETNISKLDSLQSYSTNTCVIFKPVPFDKLSSFNMDDFMRVIDILRSPEGCPWDRAQTHASLRRSLIEECYEVLEAIELEDNDKICEELGDVMLIIALHAKIAKDDNEFTMDDIIDGVSKKIISRHTHVFAGVRADTIDEISRNWDEIKKTEKNYKSQTDMLRSVPKQFPALIRSEKVQKKTAKAGLSTSSKQIYQELKTQIEQLETMDASKENEAAFELLGEILQKIANISMINKVDPEHALEAATEKFIAEFEKAEKAEQIKKLN